MLVRNSGFRVRCFQVAATICVVVMVTAVVAGCKKAVPKNPGNLDRSSLELSALALVTHIQKGAWDKAVAMFDDTMKKSLPRDKLESAWSGITASAGNFNGTKGTRYAEESGYKCVYVTCEFSKMNLDVKVVFNASGEVSGLWFLPSQTASWEKPSYADDSKFSEMSLEVVTGSYRLPAVLTLPKGDGPFPVAVLVHGSGPSDMDETIGPNKPFKDLAWGLASHGIAVLRYEKRTFRYASEIAGKALDPSSSFTVKEEVLDDAVSALKVASSQRGVDSSRVYLVGHSMGAMLAPRIAEQAEAVGVKVAGVIMLAGNARSLLDLLPEQFEYLAKLDGKVDASEQGQIEGVKQAVEKIKSGSLSPSEILLGAGKAYWDDLMHYDQVSTVLRLKQPILLMQGERDYQVTMVDFSVWKEKLASRPSSTFASYPELNHLFISGTGKSTPDEYQKPGHVDLRVIQDISQWISSGTLGRR